MTYTIRRKNRTWKIPVMWTMGNIVNVKAETLDNAIEEVRNLDYLPVDGAEYADDSFFVDEYIAREINDKDTK